MKNIIWLISIAALSLAGCGEDFFEENLVATDWRLDMIEHLADGPAEIPLAQDSNAVIVQFTNSEKTSLQGKTPSNTFQAQFEKSEAESIVLKSFEKTDKEEKSEFAERFFVLLKEVDFVFVGPDSAYVELYTKNYKMIFLPIDQPFKKTD